MQMNSFFSKGCGNSFHRPYRITLRLCYGFFIFTSNKVVWIVHLVDSGLFETGRVTCICVYDFGFSQSVYKANEL